MKIYSVLAEPYFGNCIAVAQLLHYSGIGRDWKDLEFLEVVRS